MVWLILGLCLFLGVHSVRIVADDWRGRTLAARSEGLYKIGYSVLSAIGLVLIVWGYGLTRSHPVFLWQPPMAMSHVTALLMLVALVLLAASYVPDNRLRARLGHPMVLGVKVWAFSHLLSNGRLGDLVLFGAFLVWAIVDFASARRRDRRTPAAAAAGTAVVTSAGSLRGDVIAVAGGLLLWVVFAFWAHAALIGVAPFG